VLHDFERYKDGIKRLEGLQTGLNLGVEEDESDDEEVQDDTDIVGQLLARWIDL
jgi:hypothetical protein